MLPPVHTTSMPAYLSLTLYAVFGKLTLNGASTQRFGLA